MYLRIRSNMHKHCQMYCDVLCGDQNGRQSLVCTVQLKASTGERLPLEWTKALS